MITHDDFQKVDMRVGTIVAVEDFPRAKNPSYKVQVDFGSALGTKWSSVQAKNNYTPEQLQGRQVVCTVNLEPKNIAGFMSEVLVMGVENEAGELVLLQPDRDAVNGFRVY